MRMYVCAAVATLAVAACGPAQNSEAAAAFAALPACDAATPTTCRVEADGLRLRVTFEPRSEGARDGRSYAEVLSEAYEPVQRLTDDQIIDFLIPHAQDLNGDGHIDILLPLETGNVNTTSQVWVYNAETDAYEDMGQLNGVNYQRTADSYLAVPARSSAAEWAVQYYRFDPGALTHLATVTVTYNPDRPGQLTCRLVQAPGVASLNLTRQQALDKFCDDPAAAGVFD